VEDNRADANAIPETKPERPPLSQRDVLLAGPVLLALLGLGIYASTFRNAALLHHVPDPYRDPVLGNTMLNSYQLLPKVFTGEFLLATHGEYRPVGYALFAVIRRALRGAGDWVWHGLLIGLHVCAALCVWLLLRMLLDRVSAVLLAAAYLVHPAFAHVLNDINLVYVLWGQLFSSLTLWFFLLYVRTKSLPLLVSSVLTFGLAVFSYQPALALAPFLVVLYLRQDDSPRVAAFTLVYLFLAVYLASILGAPAFVTYPVLFAVAVALCAAAPLKKGQALSLSLSLVPYAAVIVLYFAIATTRNVPGVAEVAMLHLEETGLAEAAEPWFANRCLLGASVLHTVSLALVALAPALLVRKLPIRTASAAALALFLLVTLRTSAIHRDDVTYWQYVSSASPEHHGLLLNLAGAHIADGQHEQARDLLMSLYYERQLSGAMQTITSATLAQAFVGLGNAKVAGYYTFTMMFATQWNFDIMKNLLTRAADFSFRLGYLAPAENWWASGLVIDPYDVRLYNALGRVLIYRNFFRAAAKHFRYVIQLQPENERALYYLAFIAKVRGHRGDYARFSRRWKEVTGLKGEIDFQPVHDAFRFDRDQMQGWFSPFPTRMLSPWQQSSGITPRKTARFVSVFEGKTYRFAEVPLEIARHFRKRGNYQKALTHLLDAHRADPKSKEIVELLADNYRRLGQTQEAERIDALLPGLGPNDAPKD